MAVACGFWNWRRGGGFAGKQVRVAGFLFAGTAREKGYERWTRFAVLPGFSARHAFERALHRGDVVEAVEAVGAVAQLAGGLWAAQKQQAEDCDLRAFEVEPLAGAVLELEHAAVMHAAGKAEFFQMRERLADGDLVQLHDRLAAGLLIAGVHQRVQ